MTIYRCHEVLVAVAVAELYFRFMIDLALCSGEGFKASVARAWPTYNPRNVAL